MTVHSPRDRTWSLPRSKRRPPGGEAEPKRDRPDLTWIRPSLDGSRIRIGLDRTDSQDHSGHMKTVSVSDLKASLSRYLREVRRGGEVQILRRGVPVARLTAISPQAKDEDGRRERLIRAGVIRPGRGNAQTLLTTPLLKLPASILGALDEERDDRL